MPKEARTKPSRGMSQHAPLGRQIVQGEKAAEGKLRRVKADRDEGDGDGDEYIDSKTTRKIMQQAQEQREEMEAEAHAVTNPSAGRRWGVILLGEVGGARWEVEVELGLSWSPASASSSPWSCCPHIHPSNLPRVLGQTDRHTRT